MAYAFEGAQVNITNLATSKYAYEPTGVQYHVGRINCIYRKDNLLYIQYSDDRGLTWSDVSQIVDDTNAKYPCICRNYADGWALAWAAYTFESDLGHGATQDWEILFVQALAKVSIISDLLEATTNKGVDMNVNGFRCTVSQEAHEYDFQKPNIIWEGQLIPGNELEFYAGLGSNLDKRFSGYLDSVDYKDAQGIIEVTARSRASELLDSKLNVKRQYKITETYQAVAESLLDAAGIDSDDYHVEISLVVLAEEKIFDREENYLTSLQNICDDMGWIIWEDEDGKIWVGSPTNYPANLWNYTMNVNCFALDRSLDRLNIPYKVVVSNEDTGVEKEAIVNAQTFATLNQKNIEYLQTKEDDADNIQTTANNIAADLELKIFTIDLLVPFNFYLQLRDRVTIYQTDFDPTISNVGIIIKISESLGRKGLRNVQGLFSKITVAVIS